MKNKQVLLSLLFPIVFFCVFVSASSLRSQWVTTGGPGTGASVRCLMASGPNLFTGSWGGQSGYPGGVYLSTNNGANWLPRNSGLTDTAIFGLAVIGTDLFAGTYNGGVFRSSNSGTSWAPVNTGLTNLTIYSIIAAGTNLYAGSADGVFLSTNNGAVWSYKGLTGNLIFAMEVIGSNIFAGASGNGVYRSTNNGANWIQVNTGLTNTAVQSLTASGTDLYAGTFSGVFRTTNNGANWINTGGLAGLIVNTVASSGANIFAGSSGGGIYLTTNHGSNWQSIGLGIPNTTINTLLVSAPNIYAGALNGMVYRRALSEMITSVSPVSSEIPVDFSMSQNYPNPFNPMTNVKIQMSKGGFTKLTVFDIAGKEVKVLVNEYLGAGTYKVDFDASQYSSGIYFYTMTVRQAGSSTGDYSQTRKMVLIK